MDIKDGATFNMWTIVESFCLKNVATLNAFSLFPPLFIDFRKLISDIYDAMGQQQANMTGVRVDKNILRKELEADAFTLSAMLVLYGGVAVPPLPKLVLRCKYTKSKLKLMGEKALVGACTQLLEDGRANVLGLASFNIDAPWLDAFEVRMNDFSKQSGTPLLARADKKEGTARVKMLMTQGRDLVKNKLDLVLENFISTHPDLYKGYKLARKQVAVSAEKPAIRGRVFDAQTAAPIAKASIKISTRKQINKTTAKGNFTVLRLKAGTYSATIKAKGYEEKMVEIVVKDGETGKVDVGLVGIKN